MSRQITLSRAIEAIDTLINSMTEEERIELFDEIFGVYCVFCGTRDPDFNEAGDCIECSVRESLAMSDEEE